MSEEIKQIDCTPNWETAAKMMVMILNGGSDEGKEYVKKEIVEMGKIMDHLIKHKAPNSNIKIKN